MFNVIIEFIDGSGHSFYVYARNRLDAMRIGYQRHKNALHVTAFPVTRQIADCAPHVYKQLESYNV